MAKQESLSFSRQSFHRLLPLLHGKYQPHEKIRNGENHYEDDYFGGESLTFGYEADSQKFYINRIDLTPLTKV